MDLTTWILFAVIALMGANRLLFLWSGWERLRAPFWGLQLLNLGAACALVIWGIPELRARGLHAVNLVLGALLVLHILTNNRKLQQTLREKRAARADERAAVEAEILGRLKRDGN